MMDTGALTFSEPGHGIPYSGELPRPGEGYLTVKRSWFEHDIGANYEIEITDEAGNVFKADALTPQYIYRYGFYQDHLTTNIYGNFRLEPEKIIQFFNLKHP